MSKGNSYDFKTGNIGTIKFTINNVLSVINEEGKIATSYREGSKAEWSFTFDRYSLAYISLAPENPVICLLNVDGAGSDYLATFSATLNGELVTDKLQTNQVVTYKSDYNDTTWRQKYSYIDYIATANDWEQRWPDCFTNNPSYISIGVSNVIYAQTNDNVFSYATITDVTGAGLAICPYGFFDVFTDTNSVNEKTFISMQEAVEKKDFSYIASPSNMPSLSNWYLPEERMANDSDHMYAWGYTSIWSGYNLRKASNYEGSVNEWTDAGNINFRDIIMQCVYGYDLENLNIGDKRIHKFRGIQWDVWLDGEGRSSAITFEQTGMGSEIPEKFFTIIALQALSPIATVISNPVDCIIMADSEFSTNKGYLIDLYKEKTGTELAQGYSLGVSMRLVDANEDKPISYLKHSTAFNFIIPETLPETPDEINQSYDDYLDKLKISTIGIIHFGLYDGDDYDNSGEDSDDIEEGEGYNGIGLLTKQYSLTATRAQQLGWQLWEAGFIDNIKLVNNSPMENVISLKALPFNVPGTTEEIVLGNVPMNVNGEKITSFDSKRLIGSIEITGMYNSFLDFAPFTKITIFLPFIGFKDLDVSAIMYKTLTVYYITDILTGACRAELRVNNVPFVCFDGDIGIDISLAASNRAQVEAAFITSAASNITSGVGSAASGNVEGVAKSVIGLAESAMNQYHTTNSGAPSPACSAYQTRDIYLIYDRPTYQDLKAFNRTHGRMCMLSRTLGTLSGYTVTTPNVDLSGVTATDEEKEEIVKILSSGFFA